MKLLICSLGIFIMTFGACKTRVKSDSQTKDVVLVGPEGRVRVFFAVGESVVYRECERWDTITRLEDCNAQSEKKWSKHVFKSVLYDHLALPTDYQEADDEHIYAFVKDKKYLTPIIQEMEKIQQQIAQIILHLGYYPPNKPTELAELEKRLKDLQSGKWMPYIQAYQDNAKWVNAQVKKMIEQIVEGKLTTYQHSKAGKTLLFKVLDTFKIEK